MMRVTSDLSRGNLNLGSLNVCSRRRKGIDLAAPGCSEAPAFCGSLRGLLGRSVAAPRRADAATAAEFGGMAYAVVVGVGDVRLHGAVSDSTARAR